MALAETAVTNFVTAANGVRYAYRRFGSPNRVPLVTHIHFRGSMDYWDPLLLNTIAEKREVIIFDNAGVGQSSGAVPATFPEWADSMAAFVKALGLEKVDLLGFSVGGITVPYVALNHPDLVRKLIIAGARSSAPKADVVPGVVWPQLESPPEFVAKLAGAVTIDDMRDGLRYSCFPLTPAGQVAFDEYWARVQQRTAEPPKLEPLAMDAGGMAQVGAIMDNLKPSDQYRGAFERLSQLKIHVFVANGDDDVLISTSLSYELLTQIENAQLIIYPRSGHGFLWHYARRFGEDVNRFLDGGDFESE